MQSYLNAVSVRKVYLWFPGSEMSNDVSTLVIIQGGSLRRYRTCMMVVVLENGSLCLIWSFQGSFLSLITISICFRDNQKSWFGQIKMYYAPKSVIGLKIEQNLIIFIKMIHLRSNSSPATQFWLAITYYSWFALVSVPTGGIPSEKKGVALHSEPSNVMYWSLNG